VHSIEFNLYPQEAKRNIAAINEFYDGDMLQAIADFHQSEIAPLVRSESIGAVGAAATAMDSRLSEFSKSAIKVQQALEKVREGSKAKIPKHQMTMLENIAKNLGKELNLKFQTEITKFLGKVKTGRRGTVYTNIQGGINKAKSGRSIKPIQFTSGKAFENMRHFERGANFLGKGLIVLDAGVRTGKVHLDYLAGQNWQRRAAVETVGFGLSTVAGLWVGQATIGAATGLGIAMLATPVGWCFIIGSALVLGYAAAKAGDWMGQGTAGYIYDKSASQGWF